MPRRNKKAAEGLWICNLCGIGSFFSGDVPETFWTDCLTCDGPAHYCRGEGCIYCPITLNFPADEEMLTEAKRLFPE